MPPTTPKTLGRATPRKAKPQEQPKSVKLTLGEFGSFTLEPDWTARVAAKCRREFGCTPEQIFEELAGIGGGRASVDTAVRLFVFAAWQNGTDLSYEQLLDDVKVSTPFTIDTDPGQDDSPEV